MLNDKKSDSIALKEKKVDCKVEGNINSYNNYSNFSTIGGWNKLTERVNTISTFSCNFFKFPIQKMVLIQEPLIKLYSNLVCTSNSLFQIHGMLKPSNVLTEKLKMSVFKSIPRIDYLKKLNMVNSQTFQIVQEIYQTELNYIDRFNFKPILYENIANIFLSYNNLINKNFFSHMITRPVLEDYVNLQKSLSFKINKYSFAKIEELSNFYADYTRKILDFQVNVIQMFKTVGIIEERALCPLENDATTIKTYSKVSQSLSVAYRNDIEKTITEIYKDSVFALIKAKAECIVNHVLNINKMSQLNGNPLIKPTVDTMDICCNMPNLFSNTENDFKSLIDWLYKLLWENKQRLEPYLTEGDLDFINILRRYYYHDLEHGDKKDYQKKFCAVKEFFQKACGCNYPKTSKKWLECQQYIYDKLDNVLSGVLNLLQ